MKPRARGPRVALAKTAQDRLHDAGNLRLRELDFNFWLKENTNDRDPLEDSVS